MADSSSTAEIIIPDLSDPRTYVDRVPHEAFAALRERPGFYWQPAEYGVANGGFWAVTRWADIIEIERDPQTFSSTKGVGYPATNTPPSPYQHNSVLMNDPPRHSYLRRAAAKGFGPRVIANFDDWIREIVREAIGNVAARDEFDYVEQFARTIPAYVVARVLGVDRGDRERIVNWTIAAFAATQDTRGLAKGASAIDNSQVVQAEINEYSAAIQKHKLENPADDMFTAVGALVQSGELTQDEFLNWMSTMLLAGFETTHTTIGQSMRMYLEDPVIRERTDRAVDEGLAERVAVEYLRLISPPMHMARTATRDTEICGQQVRDNDLLLLYFIAANRDPAIFSEPDEFNPWRPEKQTLAFGSGPHRCIGQHLAKLEVKILWEELRAAGVSLRLNGEPKRGWSVFINQLTELPVARA
jgi:cholest-4-en-3-one 26-monooxygenase